MVKAIFSEQKQFKDSLFYDVSAWTLSHAFDVNTTKMKDLSALGEVVNGIENPTPKQVTKAAMPICLKDTGIIHPKPYMHY